MLTATPKPVSRNGFEVSLPPYTLISFLTDLKGRLRSLYATNSWGMNSFITGKNIEESEQFQMKF